MADTKITGLTALASGFATGDLLVLVDVSDATMDAAGTNKKVTLGALFGDIPGRTDATTLGVSGAALSGSNASSFISLAGIWNTTGTPTAIFANITDTASNAASLLMELQVGGTRKFSVDKAGIVKMLEVRSLSSTGIIRLGSNFFTDRFGFAGNTSSTFTFSIGGTHICTDADHILALRNSTNAQAFRVYNTYTDGSNNEFVTLCANSNVFELAAIANGSGTLRGLRVGATGNSLGFLGATPVAQQSGTGETTGFTAGSGTAVNDDSTFTGSVGATAYRINDVVKALKNYGLLAA